MALLSADVKNGTITFTTDGSPYYVLGEKDSSSTPSDPGDSPQTGGNSYTLTFDTNGGSKIDSVSKTSGAVIDLAGYVPTRTGYVFDGWYSDAKLTNKITSVKLTKNMTVYAKWSEKNGENPFTDVADDAYYADAVTWAVGKGITCRNHCRPPSLPTLPAPAPRPSPSCGGPPGSPAPKSSDMPFTDVAAGSYYHDAVSVGHRAGHHQGHQRHRLQPQRHLHPRADRHLPVAQPEVSRRRYGQSLHRRGG